MHHYRAAVLALSALGSFAGHESGDYLVQRDCDAQAKQHRTPQGRYSLVIHASSYAATQAVTRAGIYRMAGVRVPVLAQIAGAVTEGALHALVDDGRLLRVFADATGKRNFHDLAAHGVNGRMLMDQGVHKGIQIPLGAAVTTAVATAMRGSDR